MQFRRERGVAETPSSSIGDAMEGMPSHVAKNIADIARLEDRVRRQMSASDRFADIVTRFTGSILFVALHVAWFGVWIVLSLAGVMTFDNFPFSLLTMIVSLEAIFLSAFVLISENRQASQSDRRAKVDLHVNMIAEQEITKLVSLVAEMHEFLGLHKDDPELEQMLRDTHVGHLANAVDEADAEANAASGRRGAAETGTEP